jgi:hypothetical protein
MGTKSKKITAWLLALNLLVSTMGLTVHTLYCLCRGELSISLFEVQGDCSIAAQSMHGKDCCSKTAGCHSTTASCCSKSQEHQCDTQDKIFVKLNTDFVVRKLKHEIEKLNLTLAPVVFASVLCVVDTVVTALQNYQSPSPPLRGRAFLPFAQIFLC